MIVEELTKAEKKKSVFRTLFQLFSTLFILPLLLPKSSGFLG
jgi:hypothetical protein